MPKNVFMKEMCYLDTMTQPYPLSKDILYLTTSRETFERVRQEGFYIVPVWNDKNRQQIFWGSAYVLENPEEITKDDFENIYRRLADIPWDIVRTERCFVREMIPEDAKAFACMYSDEEIRRFLDDLPREEKAIESYIKDYRMHVYAFYGHGMWTVLSENTKEVIGRCGLFYRENSNIPELGFVIASKWQNRGYAYEVCKAVIQYGREELDMKKIQAYVDKENQKSIALCKKLGFTQEKECRMEDRDCLHFEMYFP